MKRKKDKTPLINYPLDTLKVDKKLVKKDDYLDNPILRHLAKKYSLSDKDVKLLGVLLALTNNGKVTIKTGYEVISNASGISSIDVYRGLSSLKRYGIIDFKPDGNFVLVSFSEIDEHIEELDLAKKNAARIKNLEKRLRDIEARDLVDKEDLFDLLFPIIGKLLYEKAKQLLKELVYYIDRKLEELTSFKLWKYRFLSWKTKLPLSEIILRESLPYLVEEIFVIEKSGSLPVAHISRREDGIDEDLIGSMLSAINDFIKTSFDSKENINEISYGEYRIYVEEGRYFFVACVVYGVPEMDFFDKLNALIGEIHKKYGKYLKQFDGDMTKLAGIEDILKSFLDDFIEEKQQVKESGEVSLKRFKIFMGIVLSLVLFYFGFKFYWYIRDRELREKIYVTLEKHLPKYTYDVKVDVDMGEVFISGYVGDIHIADKITQVVKSIKGVKAIDNKVVKVDFSGLEGFRKILNKIYHRIALIELEKVREELSKIVITFPLGSSELSKDRIYLLNRVIEILKDHPYFKVVMVPFVDETGTYEINKKLSEDRMKAIKRYLVSKGISADRIEFYPFDPEAIKEDPIFKKYIGNRGIMFFPKYYGDYTK